MPFDPWKNTEWTDPYRMGGPRSPWGDPHQLGGPNFDYQPEAILPFLSGATELGLSLAPGSGEVMSLQDYRQAANAAAEEFQQGNILQALGHSAEAVTAGIGSLPLIGPAARAVGKVGRGVGRAVESVFEAAPANLAFRDVSVAASPFPTPPHGLIYTDPGGVTDVTGALPPPGFPPAYGGRAPSLGELKGSLGFLQGRWEREAIERGMPSLPPASLIAGRNANDIGNWVAEQNTRLRDELGFGPEELGPNGLTLEQITRITGGMIGSTGFGGKVDDSAGFYSNWLLSQFQDPLGPTQLSLITPQRWGNAGGGAVHLAGGADRPEASIRRTASHELGHVLMGIRDKDGTLDALRTFYLPRTYGSTYGGPGSSPEAMAPIWDSIAGELMVNSVKNSRTDAWMEDVGLEDWAWQKILDGDSEFATEMLKLNPPDVTRMEAGDWDYYANNAELLADGLSTVILDPERARLEMPNLARVVGDMARDPQIRQHIDMTKLFPILLAGAALGVTVGGSGEAEAHNTSPADIMQ